MKLRNNLFTGKIKKQNVNALKWKSALIISLIIFMFFLVYFIYYLISCYSPNAHYPMLKLGIEVSNRFEDIITDIMLFLNILGIPIIFNITLIIISIIKIKKERAKNGSKKP